MLWKSGSCPLPTVHNETQTDGGLTTGDLIDALRGHHCEILHRLDQHYAQQQEVIVQSLGGSSTAWLGARPVTRNQPPANSWCGTRDDADDVKQSPNHAHEPPGCFQLPGSTELEPVVPMPSPRPCSSQIVPHAASERPEVLQFPPKSHRHTITMRKKVEQRVAANRKNKWRQPPRRGITKNAAEIQTQITSCPFLLRVLHSTWFDACSFMLIAAFSAYVVLPLTTESDCNQNNGNFIVELVFCLLFAIELAVRMAPYGIKFFLAYDWMWNLADTIIVMVTCVQIILEVVTSEATPANAMTFRMLRLFRAASTLRIARVFTMFRELRLLVYSVLGCMRSLFFSLMMLFAFIVLCSTFLTVGAQACVNATEEQSDNLKKNFGTLGRSCISLYMAISGGQDWGEFYWVLETLGWQYQLVYVVYVSFSIFGLVNVFTGVFVDHAMLASSKDRDIQIRNQIDEEDHNLKELQRVFQELDDNGSGKLSLDEFESHLSDERALAYFQAVKLDVTEVGRLFRLMDTDNSGSIDIEEFIIGCQRLKGESRSLDIKIALLEIESLQHEFRRFVDNLFEQTTISRNQSGQTQS